MNRLRNDHYQAILRRMYTYESVLWYGESRPERHPVLTTIPPSAFLALVLTTFATGSFTRPASQGWAIYLTLFGLVLLTLGVIVPWLQGPTLYALTDKRALRARGHGTISIGTVWLSDLTSIAVTDRSGFGTVRCASRQPTWALGKRNRDRQPIFLRIVNPRGVYAMIITLRPDLAENDAESPTWDRESKEWLAERNTSTT